MRFLTAAFLSSIFILAGCSTEQERLKNCEAKGISKDTCYLVEKDDRREEKQQRDEAFREQNNRVIKKMGIKGLGLPE